MRTASTFPFSATINSRRASFVVPSIFPLFSLSNLTSCWFPAITRVFRVVERSPVDIIPPSSIPSSPRRFLSMSPALSLPTTPARIGIPSMESMLFATFAAPPGLVDSLSTSTSGTGASGDILSTFPHRYSSSIISPMTRILFPANFSMCFLRFIVSPN